MKKTQKAAIIALAGALTVGGAFASLAADQGNGQWCNGSSSVNPDTTWTNADGQTVSSWWFAVSSDGKQCLANTWHWIKNSDGNMYCYYFDKDGWMVVDGAVGGASIDKEGKYLENGAVVNGDDSKIFYTSSVSFLNNGSSSSNTSGASNTTNTTNTTSGTSSDGGPGSGQSNGANLTTKNKNVVKGTNSSTETPDEVAVEFSLSSISGGSISNSWANFAFQLSGFTFDKGDGNSNMDFRATNDDSGAEISINYYPINYYNSANTSFDSFVQSYLTSKRMPGALEGGAKSAKLGSDVNFGGYTYKQVVKTFKKPINSTEDFSCYLRQVEGTNYVMEIYTKNSSDSFQSVLSGMSRAR